MKIKIMKTLLSVAVVAAMSNTAFAVPIGTPAGNTISNMAVISYSVGGTGQEDIESSKTGNSAPGGGSATTFVVDEKVDLTVTTGSAVTVAPNGTRAITFTLKNEGNKARDFSFASKHDAGGTFDPTSCSTPANVVALPSGDTSTITVNCVIPSSGTGGVVNGATATIDLLAEAVGAAADAAADAGADDPDSEETVLADATGTTEDNADRNAKHSAVNTYTVNTADITVTKTQAITKMSFDTNDDGTNNSDVLAGGAETVFHIPGATIEYEIVVSNADGASAARSIVLVDPVPSDVNYVGCSVAGDAVEDTVHPAAVSVVATVPTCTYDAGTGKVTTSSFTLPGGSGAAKTETLTVTATIK